MDNDLKILKAQRTKLMKRLEKLVEEFIQTQDKIKLIEKKIKEKEKK